jgi:hypothetical protein
MSEQRKRLVVTNWTRVIVAKGADHGPIATFARFAKRLRKSNRTASDSTAQRAAGWCNPSTTDSGLFRCSRCTATNGKPSENPRLIHAGRGAMMARLVAFGSNNEQRDRLLALAVTVCHHVSDLFAEPCPRSNPANARLRFLGHGKRQPSVLVRPPNVVQHCLKRGVFAVCASRLRLEPILVYVFAVHNSQDANSAN